MKKMLFSTVVLVCLTAVTLACGAKANNPGSPASTAESTTQPASSSGSTTSAPTTTSDTTASTSTATSTTAATTSPTSTSTTPAASATAGSTASTSPTASNVDYPAPPANAVVFADAQNIKNTGSCDTASCAGGSGSGASSVAFNQTTPSLSGSSTQLSNIGSGSDSLWYWHLGANDAVSHIELDFQLMVDSASVTGTQAMENGPQQYVGGYKYSMTMQCEYTTQLWRVWDQAANAWKATDVACPHWSPKVWHRVQMYITTNQTKHTETYHTLIVDGVPHSLEQTYGVTNVGFGDNLGFQFQLDNNSAGAAVYEWLDHVTFTVW